MRAWGGSTGAEYSGRCVEREEGRTCSGRFDMRKFAGFMSPWQTPRRWQAATTWSTSNNTTAA